MSSFRFFSSLSRLLLSTYMIVATMLHCRIPMSFRSLFVIFGNLLVHFLRRSIFLVMFGGTNSQQLDLSIVPTCNITQAEFISTLRQTYGQGFAPGQPGHKKLSEILHELDVASLSQLVKGLPPPPYV